MAYLKRFTGFLLVLLLLVATSGSSAQNYLAAFAEDFRNSSNVAPAQVKNTNKNTELLEKYYANQLRQMDIKLHPETSFRKDSKSTPGSSRKCEAIVYQTLRALPFSHASQLTDLTLFYTNDGRRGLGGNGKIVLRCLNVTDAELAAVLIHEMGHLVDNGMLYGNPKNGVSDFYDFDEAVALDDPSLKFYRINWMSNSVRIHNASYLDFVSGYAATDPFEDFAETYSFYRLHGSDFKRMAKTSDALREKYEFMKNYVFDGQEFENDYARDFNVWKRHYDTTVLRY